MSLLWISWLLAALAASQACPTCQQWTGGDFLLCGFDGITYQTKCELFISLCHAGLVNTGPDVDINNINLEQQVTDFIKSDGECPDDNPGGTCPPCDNITPQVEAVCSKGGEAGDRVEYDNYCSLAKHLCEAGIIAYDENTDFSSIEEEDYASDVQQHVEWEGPCKGDCPEGQYGPDQGQYPCRPCSPGFYADIQGMKSCTACPIATYQGSAEASSCTPCPADTTTTSTGSTRLSDCICIQECQPGSFSASGYEPCSYSPGTGLGRCELCSAGTFADEAGSTSCKPSPVGYYAPKGAARPTLCPTGHYCPAKSTKPTACRVGTYGRDSGAQTAGQCVLCIAGYYCSQAGSAAPTGSCSAGYFCPSGSVSPDSMECPAGHYCPAGSGAGVECPVGTFSPDKGNMVQVDCDLCTGGSYCQEEGSGAPTGECYAGYYCPNGSRLPTEVICPAGHYCPDGSADPASCPRATYSPNTGIGSAQECLSCAEGQTTERDGATSADECIDVDCQPGWYRNEAKSHCIICPKGEFSNIVNAVACRKCPRHQYNSELGAVQCMSCPDTAYTWDTGATSFQHCIGPIIEICSEEGMRGSCYKHYDERPDLNTTIRSLNVLSGQFKLFEKTDKRGSSETLSEESGPHNVTDIGEIGVVRSFNPILNDVFCSLDKGWKFRGSVRRTARSGKACINWKRTPLASIAEPNHFCQNPDGVNLQDKPFCYISETETEECDIPACIWDKSCYTGVGSGYRGDQSTTTSGRNCQNWNSDWPHIHGYHSPKYNWAGVGEHTKCRNPDGSERPWCYTTNIFHRWNYCDIPRCSRDSFDFYMF